jgi:hypothetical protein
MKTKYSQNAVQNQLANQREAYAEAMRTWSGSGAGRGTRRSSIDSSVRGAATSAHMLTGRGRSGSCCDSVSGARWPACYEVRVEGVLDGSWSDWFEGLQIQNQGGDTVLSGILPDQPAQPALHGILDKVRDLGLSLIAVRRLPYVESRDAPQ